MRREGQPHGNFYNHKRGEIERAARKGPTNATNFRSRCRRARCRGCHEHPVSKALKKAKGCHKDRGLDVVTNHSMADWAFPVPRAHLRYDDNGLGEEEAPLPRRGEGFRLANIHSVFESNGNGNGGGDNDREPMMTVGPPQMLDLSSGAHHREEECIHPIGPDSDAYDSDASWSDVEAFSEEDEDEDEEEDWCLV